MITVMHDRAWSRVAGHSVCIHLKDINDFLQICWNKTKMGGAVVPRFLIRSLKMDYIHVIKLKSFVLVFTNNIEYNRERITNALVFCQLVSLYVLFVKHLFPWKYV